ncbi:M23 family metallopeptidase [Labrys monachus]|uniref:Murein DD-endopeptidase MepM/ murein hydrolase activator NlpD n=1 Tax=Labrys monachus TaxID=217067 RepID=A0ABU0FJD9_9HYPH|nr:M23 family metallopeptidase [Labrys monachus]MDQ0394641.1 murein DD-endopeptidase MepM/ murein hydrolase activator NlpD [Labrys monachus]
MRYRRAPGLGGLGDAPPLNVASLSDPRLDRRAINRRWLGATVALAAAAAFMMLGALYVAFDRKIHFTAAAAVFLRSGIAQVRETVDGRGDRLDPIRPVVVATPSQVHVGPLDIAGSSTPLTHLQARLGPTAPVPTATQVERRVVPPLPGFTAPSVQADGASLPPEIIFGRSRALASMAGPETPALGYTEAAASHPRGEPVNMTVLAEAPVRHEEIRKIIVAKAGDTLPLILHAFGTSEADAAAIVSQFGGWHWGEGGAFAGGEKVTVVEVTDGDAAAPSRPVKVVVEKPGQETVAVALSDAGTYTAMAKPPHLEIMDADQLNAAAAGGASPRIGPEESLRDNLYALAEANKVDRSLVDEVIRLCDRDVDMDEPASADDSVDLVYGPDDSGQPQLAYVGLTVDGHLHRYYRFTAPDDGGTDYYDADGHSVTKFLLRKPVASGRLGDGFGWRIHPVLHDRRFHKGVDYAAPFGSPVAAAGAGVVEKIDQEWGYGKYIRVRHDQGYETTYAHVSGFPKGIKVGTRVHQGETIAYIGSTGLSTGPHLYYEVRINGENVDPLRIRLAAGRLLGGSALTAFREQRAKLDQAMTR